MGFFKLTSLRVIIPLALIGLTSCFIKDLIKPLYTNALIPDTATNFEEINTEFDDYNSALNLYGESFPLCFSTNRKSEGENFDLFFELITIEFDLETGIFDIRKYQTPTSYSNDFLLQNSNIIGAFKKINTDYNELGPFLIPQDRIKSDTNSDERYNAYVILYSSDEEGNQNIMFTQNIEFQYHEDPLPVEFLNSDFDDAYPTFNKDNSEIYFTSNRNGPFDILKAKTDNTEEIVAILSNTETATIETDANLSSLFDDKCPYIFEEIMVFTSNREGGFGGYDLYYSYFENGEWGSPINFGAKINSEYDEYRPVVRPQEEFKNDFMIFSSNRPGGKGGFDLYYVGIDKIKR